MLMSELWRRLSPTRDDGVALALVMLGISVVAGLGIVIGHEAVAQNNHAHYQKRDDVLVANGEALLDRYAAKLTIDPAYHLHWVDEAERTRRCTDGTIPANLNVEVGPGNAWLDGCRTWDYPNAPTDSDWFVHPLFDAGVNPSVGTATRSLIEVTPPESGLGVHVQVVAEAVGRGQLRAISAEIRATALSEFFRVTENNLSYGSGAIVTGKIYSGGTLNFSNPGIVHRDIYSEGGILNPPTFESGAEAFDTTGSWNDIREVFPQPLNFDNFWDDLNVLQQAACNGGGLCFDDPSAEAWLIHPHVQGGVGYLDVWMEDDNHGSGCVSNEEFWWLEPHDGSVNWSYQGRFQIPKNGAVWANEHVVVGNRDSSLGESGWSTVKGGLTIYAGSVSDPKNIILNADTTYSDPASFDVTGLIASDEVILVPDAVGNRVSEEFHIRAALLGQESRWRVARACGSDGSVLTDPGNSTLFTQGSIATRTSGDIAAHFSIRNYGFDPRLEFLRPPFYPLLSEDWSYESWSEDSIPDWAS